MIYLLELQYCLSKLQLTIEHVCQHCLACATYIQELKHSVCGLDANKALGCTSYFISTSTSHLMFYFTHSTHGNASTITYLIYIIYSHVITSDVYFSPYKEYGDFLFHLYFFLLYTRIRTPQITSSVRTTLATAAIATSTEDDLSLSSESAKLINS